MFNRKTLCFSALLLALGMLLGLTAIGCSDKDRNKNGDIKVGKSFTYTYKIATETAEKEAEVDPDAKYVSVCALDADGNTIEKGAELTNSNAVANQYDATTGLCYADTDVVADAIRVVYSFYKVNDDGSKEVVTRLAADISNVADGETVASSEDDVVNLSIKCYLSDGIEAEPTEQDVFTVGDVIIVKVFDGNVDITHNVNVISDSDKLLQRQGTQNLVYQAIAAGVNSFSVEFDGSTNKDVKEITIYEAEPEITNLYVCPTGYNVKDNQIVDNNGAVVEAEKIPTTVGELAAGATYTFTVIGLYDSGTYEVLTREAAHLKSSDSHGEFTIFTLTNANQDSTAYDSNITASLKNGSAATNTVSIKLLGK